MERFKPSADIGGSIVLGEPNPTAAAGAAEESDGGAIAGEELKELAEGGSGCRNIIGELELAAKGECTPGEEEKEEAKCWARENSPSLEREL